MPAAWGRVLWRTGTPLSGCTSDDDRWTRNAKIKFSPGHACSEKERGEESVDEELIRAAFVGFARIPQLATARDVRVFGKAVVLRGSIPELPERPRLAEIARYLTDLAHREHWPSMPAGVPRQTLTLLASARRHASEFARRIIGISRSNLARTSDAETELL